MADIICFPQERNVGKARHVARLYLGKRTSREQQIYWKMICDRLAGWMERAGFQQADIDRQTAAFLRSVEWQIHFMTNKGNGPGAA